MATIREVTEGLQILMKYSNVDEHNIQSEHDEIFGPGCAPEKMAESDAVSLMLLGWTYDKGLDCWKMFT